MKRTHIAPVSAEPVVSRHVKGRSLLGHYHCMVWLGKWMWAKQVQTGPNLHHQLVIKLSTNHCLHNPTLFSMPLTYPEECQVGNTLNNWSCKGHSPHPWSWQLKGQLRQLPAIILATGTWDFCIACLFGFFLVQTWCCQAGPLTVTYPPPNGQVMLLLNIQV